MAANEDGLRREACLGIISLNSCPEAFPLLRTWIVQGHSELRSAALEGILRIEGEIPGLQDLLESLLEYPEDKLRGRARAVLFLRYPEDYMDEFVASIWGKGPLRPYSALVVASAGNVGCIVNELEKFIERDEKRRPNDAKYRALAAEGIWKATGRKIMYKKGLNRSRPYPWDKKEGGR